MGSPKTLVLKSGVVAVRVRRLKHVRALRSLTRKIWRQHFPGIITPEQIEYMLRKFYGLWSIYKKLWRGEIFYLIRAGKDYVGYFSYTLEPDLQSAQLNKFFLLNDLRGQGIARAAFAHMMHVSKNAGATKMWLAINRKNKDSIAAWEHLGFKIVREEAFNIGNGFVMDDYIMERRL